MKNLQDGLGVKNMSDLILKEICGIYETKNLTKEQMKKYKMTEREIFERWHGEKKGKRKIDGSRKKLMIPGSEIPECREHEVKSKIGNIFVNEKILEEYFVKIDEIDPYFCEHYKEKIQVNKNGCEYILFSIDIYFTEYLLTVEIDEKKHAGRDLIFEEKRQKALQKKLGCQFIRVNISKRYGKDYEIGRIQTVISKFKERQLKQLNKKLKELEHEIEKLTGQITQ